MKLMRKIITAAALTLGAMTLSGCIGERVEVPPASVGMVLGSNGYQGDIIPPSRFRLDPCLFQCDKLVVVVAGDIGMTENMDVLMPKDNLILGVGVQFTLALSVDKNQLLSVFDRVIPTYIEGGNYGVTIEQIYRTYGESIVRNIVRSTLADYTIAELSSNQAAVSEQLRRNISEALKKTPLEIKQFGLSNLTYPEIIKDAMESARQKMIDIEKTEAETQISIRQAQGKLEVAKANRAADLLAAETIAEANRIIGDAVTPTVIRYLEIEALKIMSENPANTIYFPVEMTGSLGLENRIFNGPVAPKQ